MNMKRFTLLLSALAITGAAAFAQTYKTNLSATPDIVDLFCAAAPHDACDIVAMDFVADIVKGKEKPSYAHSTVDKKNGYIKVEIGENEDYKMVESCYWKMNNGNRLLAISHVNSAEPMTLHFYEFNPKARTLKAIPQPFDLFLEYTESLQYELPQHGKSIKAISYDYLAGNGKPYSWSITWNGKSFDIKRVN